MSKILSHFHFSHLFIEGRSLESSESLHDELSFKLGLPSDYGRDWEDLLECLSSIGSKAENLCGHWDWVYP
ncbi:MAG: barstar family protein [Fuerstiella sp.]